METGEFRKDLCDELALFFSWMLFFFNFRTGAGQKRFLKYVDVCNCTLMY